MNMFARSLDGNISIVCVHMYVHKIGCHNIKHFNYNHVFKNLMCLRKIQLIKGQEIWIIMGKE